MRLPTLFAIVVLLVRAVPVDAQQSCQRSASCDTTIVRSLDFESGACLDGEVRRYDTFAIRLSAGQTVRTDVQSAFFAPSIQLITPFSSVAVQDTNENRLPSASVTYSVTMSGEWFVRVRNIEVGTGGPYTLRITCDDPTTPPRPAVHLSSMPISLTVKPPAAVTLRIVGSVDGSVAFPVNVSIRNLPPGVIANPDALVFTETVASGDVTLTITNDAAGGTYSVISTAIAESGETAIASSVLIIDAPCLPPAIYTHPSGTSVHAGESARLSVIAKGTPSLMYQWYRGISGRTTSPVAGATGADMVTEPLHEPGSFWARVSNRCGSQDSAVASVTISSSSPGKKRSVRH